MAIVCLTYAFEAIGILFLLAAASLLNESGTITVSLVIQFGFTLKMASFLRSLRSFF